MGKRRKRDAQTTWDEAQAADRAFIEAVPALKAYLRRVEAEIKNFRRAIVREKSESGYWHDVAIIKWAEGGEIECSNPEYAPTKEEQAAIDAELADPERKWFTSVRAWSTDVDVLRRKLKGMGIDVAEDMLFEFHDPKSAGDLGPIVFVQVRVDNPNAEIHSRKRYVPWTLWSDGLWRSMEPDGKLPIYGLENLVEGSDGTFLVFLHEGPKPPRLLNALARDHSTEGHAAREAHPWGADLFARDQTNGQPSKGAHGIVHLGWIGGATNPHRADLERLRALPPNVQIIVVCDHDRLGMKVIRELSRALRRSLTQIKFDDRFEDGFDLADPFFDPRAWKFKKRYRRKEDGEWQYIGPSFRDCSFPATWATKQIPSTAPGRPAFVVRDEFLAEWFYVVEQDVFIHRHHLHRLEKPEQFNSRNAPFSDIKDLATKAKTDPDIQVDTICYRPGGEKTINGPTGRAVNTWTPTNLRSPGLLTGDIAALADFEERVRRYIEFMEHLIPDPDDRRAVMNYLATLATHPEIRMRYALLLISVAQGTGKGTLAQIARMLVGEHNASTPDEKTILNSAFNDWMLKKRLATVAEIHGTSPKIMYRNLQAAISDDNIDVNIKFIPTFPIENYIHLICCSNFLDALNIPNEDRRWSIIRVTEDVWPEEKWKEFYGWLEDGGYNTIYEWAFRYIAADEKRIVRTYSRPPMNAAKRSMIVDSRSEGEGLAHDLAAVTAELTKKVANGGKLKDEDKIIFTLDDVQDWVQQSRGIKDPTSHVLEKPKTLRKALVAGGMFEPEREKGNEQRRFMVPPLKQNGKSATSEARPQYVVANFPILPKVEWPALAAFRKDPAKFLAIRKRRPADL